LPSCKQRPARSDMYSPRVRMVVVFLEPTRDVPTQSRPHVCSARATTVMTDDLLDPALSLKFLRLLREFSHSINRL
jgi:hypothetical protein